MSYRKWSNFAEENTYIKRGNNLSRLEHAQLTFIIRLLVVVALKSFILISGSS